MRRSVVASVSVVVFAASVLAASQQPPASQQPQQGQGRGAGRRGGGGGQGPGAPLPFADRTDFKAIFDGKSLNGWDGDPDYWRVEGDAIVGETTEAKALKENTFIIYRGGEPADFELKVEYRINATNSGIQYRSVHLPQGTPSGNSSIAGKWVLKGYQADIDIANQYTGMLYEERARGFLAPRGSVGTVFAAPRGTAEAPVTKGLLGSLESSDALKAYIKDKDWNEFHVIARGSTLIHILNGHVTAVFVDDDAKNRTLKGLLGFQIHVGPPMKVEFRNVLLKTL